MIHAWICLLPPFQKVCPSARIEIKVFESKSMKFRVGMGTAYRGIEQAVLGMKKGEAKTIEVSAAEGYGEIVAKKIVKIPRRWDRFRWTQEEI